MFDVWKKYYINHSLDGQFRQELQEKNTENRGFLSPFQTAILMNE